MIKSMKPTDPSSTVHALKIQHAKSVQRNVCIKVYWKATCENLLGLKVLVSRNDAQKVDT